MWILDELKKRSESEKTAIIHRDRRLSFKELWEGSEKIAKYIKDNTSTQNPILIYGNKDVEIVQIMMGTLKSGRAYVPIDITFPEERVRQISEITNAELLFNITDIRIMAENNTRALDFDNCKDILNNGTLDASDEASWVQGDDNC